MLDTPSLSTEVQQWMTPGVVTILSSTTIREALDLLRDERVSALPVIGKKGEFCGIVTIADFLHAMVATDEVLDSQYPHFDDCLWAVDLIQRRLGTDKVSSLMTEVVTTVRPDQTMREAAEIMLKEHLHHLAVCNSRGELVGILSSIDFVRMARGSSRTED